MVDDEPSEMLWRQLTSQGLDGIELYQGLVQRLPRARQRNCVRWVRVPLRALVYGWACGTFGTTPGPTRRRATRS